MSHFDSLLDDLLIQGASDELELGWIVAVAKKLAPGLSETERRLLVLEVLEALFEKGLIRIQDFDRARSPQWIVWTGSPEDLVKRVKREWIALGRDPEFGTGEIGWITLTDVGKRAARERVGE